MSAEPTMQWGSSPEFFGPAHLFRVGLLSRWFRGRVPGGGRVLDLGCGRGTLSHALADAGYSVVGLDRSAEFVRYAEGAATNGSDGRATFVEADATVLPFADAAFDGVVSGEVLEHLPDDAAAAREVRRVLKPGGWFVLTVPAGPSRFGWTDRWAGHHRRYERAGLRGLLLGAGLRVERVAYWGFPIMRMYQAAVQRPVIAARNRSAATAGMAGAIGRNPVVVALVTALFRLDPIGERISRGAGLIAVAQRPAVPVSVDQPGVGPVGVRVGDRVPISAPPALVGSGRADRADRGGRG